MKPKDILIGGGLLAGVFYFLTQKGKAAPITVNVSLVSYGFDKCNDIHPDDNLNIIAILKNNTDISQSIIATTKVNNTIIGSKDIILQPNETTKELTISSYIIPQFTGQTKDFTVVIELSEVY